MNAVQSSDQKAKVADRHLVLSLPVGSVVRQEEEQVQEAIRQLRNEVKRLQYELARTRRALEQREILLRNAQQRETEFRAEAGVR